MVVVNGNMGETGAAYDSARPPKARYQIVGIWTNGEGTANRLGLEQSAPFGRALGRLS